MRNVCEVLRAKARGEVPELPDLPEPVQAAQAAPAPLVAATNEAADAADAADAAVTADLPAADAAVPWPADMPADISAVWLAVSLFFWKLFLRQVNWRHFLGEVSMALLLQNYGRISFSAFATIAGLKVEICCTIEIMFIFQRDI